MSSARYPTFVDGTLHAPGAGAVSTDDQGFQLGLAVFDTLLHEDGCRYFEEAHLARLEAGARALGIAWPLRWDLPATLARYCEALGPRDCALRITVTRGVPAHGATLVVGARDVVPPPPEGVVVSLERGAKVACDPLENVKSTNRLRNVLAREAAQRAGAWEALLASDEGDVLEGTVSNVWALVDGVVVTPPEGRGALAGVMRGELLAELAGAGIAHRVERLDLADLARAAEVWLSNTTARVIPVLEVGGVVAGLPGPRGELARDLACRIREREARYRAARLGRR